MAKPEILTEQLADLTFEIHRLQEKLKIATTTLSSIWTIDDLTRLKHIYPVVEQVIEMLQFNRASFDFLFPNDSSPLPKTEKEVTEFIKQRTKIYIDTWCVGPLETILKGKEKEML